MENPEETNIDIGTTWGLSLVHAFICLLVMGWAWGGGRPKTNISTQPFLF